MGKSRKAKGIRFVILIFVFFIAVTVAGGYLSYNYVVGSHKELEKDKVIAIAPGQEISFEVPRGADTSDIAELLKEKGLIKNTLLFKILSKINGYDGMYQSGIHIVSTNLKYDDLMRILTGKPESIKVTIPEGLTYKQVVNRLVQNKVIESAEAFDKVVRTGEFNYTFLKDIPTREFRLEGYLFPDTYEFGVKAKIEDVVNAMLKNFNNKFKEEYYKQANKMGMTVDQIIILASIIEREAKVPEERSLISGVFYNRLKSKDASLKKLQSCATIQYIFLNREGTVKERITEADTKIVDPYNTYIREGLPPGPICNPGEASIKAALYPDTGDGYLYFVARGDGTHKFSKTYKDHQAAIKQYGQFN